MVNKNMHTSAWFYKSEPPPPLGYSPYPQNSQKKGASVSNAQGAIEVIKRPCCNCIALSEERGK